MSQLGWLTDSELRALAPKSKKDLEDKVSFEPYKSWHYCLYHGVAYKSGNQHKNRCDGDDSVWKYFLQQRCFCPPGLALCSSCDVRRQIDNKIFLELHNERVLNGIWTIQEKRDLLEKERREKETREKEQHLRMEKLLEEAQRLENEKSNRDYWARQEALKLQQQQELRQRKQKELLDKELRKKLELRQTQHELIENHRLLCKLDQGVEAQRPHPPKDNLHAPRGPRGPRKVLPFTGKMPKVV